MPNMTVKLWRKIRDTNLDALQLFAKTFVYANSCSNCLNKPFSVAKTYCKIRWNGNEIMQDSGHRGRRCHNPSATYSNLGQDYTLALFLCLA